MGAAVRLPNELREFLQLPGPQSLIIRGPPGSGKTTLSLALLEAAAGNKVLVTNRVPSQELGREFPWLGHNGSSSIQVVDASDMELSLHGISHAVAQAQDLLTINPGERGRLSEFLTLPAPIQDAWSRLPNDAASTVVVDSWDALVEHYLGRRAHELESRMDRGELERMLIRLMGRSPSHLVLVLETEAQSQLDYLVNGVVVTRRELVNDRLERWLQLPKLRGIRIANASYPYTVEGARFQCIEPLNAYGEIQRGHPDIEPDRMPGFIWPGSKGFAEAFGRLAIGRLTLVEVGEEVPDYVAQHLIEPAAVHAVQNGARVLVLPSPALSADEIWGPLEDARPGGHLAESFRVLDVSGQLERGLRGDTKGRLPSLISIKSLPSPSPDRDPDDNEISRWLKGGVAGGPAGVVTLYSSGLESLAATLKIPITSETASGMPATIQNTLGGTRLHIIAVAKSTTPLFQPIKSLASIHIRLVNRQGRVLVYGLKPWTPGFVLTESTNGGPYDLLRIV
jgi:KaiC/GvpD/RAD55 family RecA-like ATPase